MTSLVLRLIDRCAWRSWLRAASPRLAERARPSGGTGDRPDARDSGTPGSHGAAGRVGIQPSVLGSLSRGSGVCQRLSPNFPRYFPRPRGHLARLAAARQRDAVVDKMTAPV